MHGGGAHDMMLVSQQPVSLAWVLKSGVWSGMLIAGSVYLMNTQEAGSMCI